MTTERRITMLYSYDRRKMARGRLDSKVRREVNAELIRAGLDGNGRYRKVGEALSVAFDVLGKHGMEPDETLNSHLFMNDSGTRNIDLAFTNQEDPFSPQSIDNTTLHMSWHELQPGRFEVVAYLS